MISATGSGNTGALVGYNTKTATSVNCYYLTGSAAAAYGGTEAVDGTAMSADDMRADTFVATLGNTVFKSDFDGDVAINDGYPIFTWQNEIPCAVSVSTEASNLRVNDEFTVFVTVKGGALASAQATVAYDATALQLVSIEQGDGLVLGEGGQFCGDNGIISFDGNTAATSTGIQVAKITFKCIGESDGALINVKDACGSRSADPTEIELEVGSPVNLPVGEEIFAHTVGDVNNNGRINIVDAQVTLDLANGVYGVKYEGLIKALAAAGTNWNYSTIFAAADVNVDGVVNADDARAIQVKVHEA